MKSHQHQLTHSLLVDIPATPRDVPQLAEIQRYYALLLPAATTASAHSLQDYALAYVDQYYGDIVQTEQEWEVLYVAALQALENAEYAVVIRLVRGLTHVLYRLNDIKLAKRLLAMGIEASYKLTNAEAASQFFNCLGNIYCGYGDFKQGLTYWQKGIAIAQSSNLPQLLWEPLFSFAYATEILDDFAQADHFVKIQPDHESYGMAVALFARGFYARLADDFTSAAADFSRCLALLSETATPVSGKDVFRIVVQSELQRTQEHYALSQALAETAYSLAASLNDPFTVRALLFDKARYAFDGDDIPETRKALARIAEINRQMETPIIGPYTAYIQAQLTFKEQQAQFSGASPEQNYDSLSRREREIVQLVAQGHSNLAIAEELSVSLKTVKKHLENIFSKLGVHNRTAALAVIRPHIIASDPRYGV